MLGKGGMGVVYKATDINLQRPVALKFLHTYADGDEEARERFRTEARAASALDHPNICSIYEIGETDEGSLFIAMAYYEGETLDEVMGRREISIDEAVDIVTGVADGLAAAHRAEIVHRDVKPANIMLLENGGVRILDFGLAKMQNFALTRDGSTLGTANYMSPEQLQGAEVDHRTDIWALGVLLYELIAGRAPFSGEYEQAVLYAVVNSAPDAIDKGPEWVRQLIDRCLEKNPDDRFQSAEEVAVALRSTDAGPIGPRSTASGQVVETGSPVRGWRGLAIAGTLAVALVLVVGFLMTQRGGDALPSTKHIAVLPFVNVGESSSQPFVDGLVHAVSSQIAGMEQFQGQLWVVPAVDVFRKNITTSDEAAKELHVNLALTGSVWVTEQLLQLTLNLVDAESGRMLRTALLEVPQSDVIQIQDGVVSKVAEIIEVELRPEEAQLLTAGSTTVPGAYEFYTRARGYLSRYENEVDIARAVDLFKRAVDEDRNYALGYAGLGEAFWRRYDASNDPADADSALLFSSRALELNDRLPAVQNTIGLVYQGMGQYEEAESSFRKAIEIEPASDAAYRALGETLQSLGRLDEAEEAYRTAVSIKPDYWANYNELGKFYWDQNEYEKAIDQFEQVVILAPENPWGYNNLAIVYESQRQFDKAKEFYEQASVANPSARSATSLAYYNLGGLATARDDYEEAVDLYLKSIDRLESDFYAWSELGGAYHWLGETSEAVKAWRRAVALARESLEVNPRSPETVGQLAMDYAKLGRADSAQVFLDSLLNRQIILSDDLISAAVTNEVLGRRETAVNQVLEALELGYPYYLIEFSSWLEDMRSDSLFVSGIRKKRE